MHRSLDGGTIWRSPAPSHRRVIRSFRVWRAMSEPRAGPSRGWYQVSIRRNRRRRHGPRLFLSGSVQTSDVLSYGSVAHRSLSRRITSCLRLTNGVIEPCFRGDVLVVQRDMPHVVRPCGSAAAIVPHDDRSSPRPPSSKLLFPTDVYSLYSTNNEHSRRSGGFVSINRSCL
jgi:hypothetical protein